MFGTQDEILLLMKAKKVFSWKPCLVQVSASNSLENPGVPCGFLDAAMGYDNRNGLAKTNTNEGKLL
jgi:hypothetical protein